MAEYDSSIATARRLLYKKGTAITLIKPSVVNTDTDKPWRGASSVDDQDPDETRSNKGVFTKFNKSEIDGKNILFSDQKIIMPVADADNIEITEDQMNTYKILATSSKRYRIVNFDVVKPGDQVIIYHIQARL